MVYSVLYTILLTMNILALDQSLSATGKALFNINYNNDSYTIESIKISTLCTSAKLSFEDRLLYIYNDLCKTVEEQSIDTILYEGIFKSLNVNTLIKLAKVQGIVELIISKYKLSSSIVTPKEWQSYLLLNKIKDKNKSLNYINNQDLILNKVNRPNILNTHTADAICIGIYFLNK